MFQLVSKHQQICNRAFLLSGVLLCMLRQQAVDSCLNSSSSCTPTAVSLCSQEANADFIQQLLSCVCTSLATCPDVQSKLTTPAFHVMQELNSSNADFGGQIHWWASAIRTGAVELAYSSITSAINVSS